MARPRKIAKIIETDQAIATLHRALELCEESFATDADGAPIKYTQEHFERYISERLAIQDQWWNRWQLDSAIQKATTSAEVEELVREYNSNPAPVYLRWPTGGVRSVLFALRCGEKLTARGMKNRFKITLTEAKRKAKNCFDRKRGLETLELLNQILPR